LKIAEFCFELSKVLLILKLKMNLLCKIKSKNKFAICCLLEFLKMPFEGCKKKSDIFAS